MSFRATSAEQSEVASSVGRLATFFPSAMRMRIPVTVASLRAGSSSEETVIEYGTAREVIFEVAMLLNFEDRVRFRNSDGSLDVEGNVVAVQLNTGRSAVAVRFDSFVNNWIIKG